MYYGLMLNSLDAVLDTEEREDYTSGDCWALAEELHRQGGFKLYAMVCDYSEDQAWDEVYWFHMLVKVGDLYLDAKGFADSSSLLAEWRMDGTSFVEVPDQDAFNDLVCDQVLQFRSRDEIRAAALRLIEAMEKTQPQAA